MKLKNKIESIIRLSMSGGIKVEDASTKILQLIEKERMDCSVCFKKTTNKLIAEWVSVNERLPKNKNEVLIKDETYNDTLGIGSYREKKRWAISGSNYWQPTHWLELENEPFGIAEQFP